MTCKCFLDPQWQPEGSYKLGSLRPSICLGIFFELYHCFFLNFGMVLKTHMRLYVIGPDFLGFFFFVLFFFFTPKIGKNGPKTRFFEFIEKFGHQFLLNLFYNENIICRVPAQIPYLGKFLFLGYGPKCSQPIRLHNF